MADNLAYQNDYQDEYRSELLNGVTIMMAPRPSTRHNSVLKNIFFVFESYLRRKACKAFPDGTDVYLTEKDRVIPDVMIVCNKDIIKRMGIYGIPDLIVEVLSHSTEKIDKGYKKKLYERCGVREYWLVDPDAEYVEVYILKNREFVLDDIYRFPPDDEDIPSNESEKYKTVIPVSLYDDFSVSLEDIFWDLP